MEVFDATGNQDTTDTEVHVLAVIQTGQNHNMEVLVIDAT